MFGDKRGNTPGGEEFKHTEGAHTAQELVGKAVKNVIAVYEKMREFSEAPMIEGIAVEMSGATLRPQLLLLDEGNSRHKFVAALLKVIEKTYETIKGTPEMATSLCDYMLSPQRKELECFFARELLQKHLFDTGFCDILTQNSTCLAEHLTRLRKTGSALRTDFDDRALLSEIEKLTTQPKLWLAVLDNVLECEKMGTKAHFVVEKLRNNLSRVENDPAVAKKT